MLIGIDASRANKDHKSGTEWYSYYLIRWFAKLDDKNQYILYSDKPLKGGLVNFTTNQHVCDLNIKEEEPEWSKDGFQLLKSPHNNFKGKILKWPFKYFWTQGRLSLEMLFFKPDMLFVPAHTLPVIHPKKSVVTIHDIGFERDRLMYGREEMGPEYKLGRKIINILIKIFTLGKYGANSLDYLYWSTYYALKRAKKIITVSNFSKKEIIDVYGPKRDLSGLFEKIKVVHNGYNKFLYDQKIDDSEIKKVLNKYDIRSPYILYIGRLEKKKNTPALIEAFAIMKEKNKNIKHKLVLVGDASFGYDEVKYQISEFMLDEEVIMPGWVEEDDMPILYCGASVFVFPSLYEGFGIPLLQAMACGVPVAASGVAAIPEVTDDAAILFDPHNTRDIAATLEKIITDDDLRAYLKDRGQAQVKNFGWEKCARETLAVLNDL